jgi:hypothetical protein
MDFTKPRVAIYYDVLPQTNFRNDGAPLFIYYNLRKILNGEDNAQIIKNASENGNVVHLSPISPLAQHGTFDLNVLVDYGEDNLGIPLDWKLPSPNAYWAFDTHIDEKGYQYRLNRAKQFDHVFLCHKGQMDAFVRDGIPAEKIHYLPVAAETDCYRPFPIMKKYNWCFIGHLNSENRVDLMDRFVKEFGLGDQSGYLGWRFPQVQGHNVLEDAAKKISMSRFAINDSIKNDLNMRTFEVMATGTPLITQENAPLLELFEPGKHLLTFRTIDEAVRQAKVLLANPSLQAEIGKAGMDEVIAKHTYNHRTLEILKTTINYIPKGELVHC